MKKIEIFGMIASVVGIAANAFSSFVAEKKNDAKITETVKEEVAKALLKKGE